MNNGFEQGPVFPYPLRPSSFVEKEQSLKPEASLELSDEEKKILVEYESEWYEELKEIKKLKIETHEVFVEALLTEKGQRMVEVVYGNGEELKKWTKEKAEECGLDMKDEDIRSSVYEAVFEDIFGKEKSEGTVVFSHLAGLVKEKTDKEVVIEKEIGTGEGDLDEGRVEEIFAGLDLKAIPYRWRKEIHDFSTGWAREKTKEQLWSGQGDVRGVDNLNTICRIEDPETNRLRIDKLKDFKRKIKEEQLRLEKSEEKIDKARVIVLDIYRKYVNWQLADDLLMWSAAGVDGKEIMKPAVRLAEGLDKFVYGVGEETDDLGNWKVLTEGLTKRVQQIEGESETVEEKYRISSDEAVVIADWMLKEYGFDKEWKSAKRKTEKSSMGISKGAKKVYIPGEMDRGLGDFLSAISHEIEGHVLSHNNEKALAIKLKIMEKYSAGGRDATLEEAGAKWAENMTWKWIFGTEKAPESIYFRGLELKKKGGTFRDCLGLIMEIRTKRIGKTKEEVYKDRGVYEQIFNYAYDRAQRLFKEHTPLGDDSGKITTSDQLKYLEQEKVAEALIKNDLAEVLFVNGFDLYSVRQLMELGMLDKSKVRRPELVVVNKLWPTLERGLKAGKTVKEIVGEMS